MRPQSLPRLIRVNQSILHRQCMLMLAVCLRISQRRCLSSREIDQNAQENFNQKATSKSVNYLLKNPQRDIHNYDKKPSIQFSSPAISALHARIGLPATFPLTTLGRCLTDPSTENDHSLHNEALSVIGSGLLEYYVSEYLCVRWPRLPMKTQLAALWAFTGESALARIARDWGVQSQTAPKQGEKRNPNDFDNSPRLLVNAPSTEAEKENYDLDKNMEWEVREQARQGWLEPRGKLARKGFLNNLDDKDYEKRFILFALQRFVQSLVGGVYIHSVCPSMFIFNIRAQCSLKRL
jgi:dsRNA-specific ribonuclease